MDPDEARCPPELLERRRFLSRVTLALGGVASLLVGLPVVGFIFAPLLHKSPLAWRKVGSVGGFRVGETVEVAFDDASPLPWAGITGRTAAWLRRDGEDAFTAFSVNCTHLGCPVRWVAQADLFLCPCHGGVYYKDGHVAAGPPPAPLHRYPVRIRDGQVEVEAGPIPIA